MTQPIEDPRDKKGKYYLLFDGNEIRVLESLYVVTDFNGIQIYQEFKVCLEERNLRLLLPIRGLLTEQIFETERGAINFLVSKSPLWEGAPMYLRDAIERFLESPGYKKHYCEYLLDD